MEFRKLHNNNMVCQLHATGNWENIFVFTNCQRSMEGHDSPIQTMRMCPKFTKSKLDYGKSNKERWRLPVITWKHSFCGKNWICALKKNECLEEGSRYRKKVETERTFEVLVGLNRHLDDVRGRCLDRRPLPYV